MNILRKMMFFVLLCLAITPFVNAQFLIDSNLYAFDASAKTVTLTNQDFDVAIRIWNTTDDVLMFEVGNPDKGGSTTLDVVTLNFNSTNMSDGDSLLIEYQPIIGLICPNPIDKYGRTTNADSGVATDVHDGADVAGGANLIWDAPNAARIHAIVSSSDADSDVGGAVAQGNGARTISVCGLKTWALVQTCETVIMDGTTAVNTAEAYVIIHRMSVLTYSTGGPNTGIIKATAATDGTITAQILAGAGQTQMGIYGIPSTQTLYITHLYASQLGATPSTTNGTLSLLVNPLADSFQDDYITKHNEGQTSTGNSDSDHSFRPMKIVPGPAIIKVQIKATSADTDVSAGFDACLRAN